MAIFKSLGSKFEIAKSLYYYGLMLNSSGNKYGARKYLARVLAVFKELNARGWIKKVKKGKESILIRSK